MAKPMSKQHASPPELGKGNAQGPVDSMHEPNKINGPTKMYFALAHKKLKCMRIKILRHDATFKNHLC